MSKFRKPRHPIRFVTAASLFDGHDASINVIRRLLQEAGCEVVHLGHNRSVEEIVTAAIQEDAQGIAVSSYQGGHMEFFKFMKDLLRERGADHIKLFAGGGGTIVPREITELQDYGIDRVFSPEDGRQLGLEGMIDLMIEATDFGPLELETPKLDGRAVDERSMARLISWTERNGQRTVQEVRDLLEPLRKKAAERTVPVIGITGPGGAGKSSFTDEIVRRLVLDFPELRVSVLAVDPSKKRTGGALLGDRIRMNAIYAPGIYMRSLATRGAASELSVAVTEALDILKGAGSELILLESSGIGQGSSAIVEVADVSVYVMTPEFGAATQLEKIDMIDLADIVVVNKFDRQAGPDALRDVRKQYRRAHQRFEGQDEELPVFGTMSSQFNDAGVTAAYLRILEFVGERVAVPLVSPRVDRGEMTSRVRSRIIPLARINYLSQVAETVRGHRVTVLEQAALVRRYERFRELRAEPDLPPEVLTWLEAREASALGGLTAETRSELAAWKDLRALYSGDDLVFSVRGQELRQVLRRKTLSGIPIPRVVLPRLEDGGAILEYLALEGPPGRFPFTAGVFPLKREDEDPKRMFAGEGPPGRTNRRFHLLCAHESAKRLSTAFDSVTLYGQDPDLRPDIYGKVGESGVSICTLDDMKALFAGFDLCDANTSVSMTINGPAPIILAFFLNAAIDQQLDLFREREGKEPDPSDADAVREATLRVVRGTVQADILKEDQAQNTCIFSTEFALKMMGDVQQFFIDHQVRNYYSVSISGYHIAEAGANPITQLALTLANGFTYVEYYLARGMDIDAFAPNLSFFFSNGLDAEYTVLGRVARRIWAIAMRDRYGANERSQKLKYHIQTSGRSLHAQEIDFNDIRTTLQALMALSDHCNSLHTNAFDEAVTTPTEESVRRAMAIQLIITKEHGLSKNENSLQGSYIVQELTELVENAVLCEFDRISERGGVLGAMETQYQRSRIQEESLHYERLKHSGDLPIVGVNTFVRQGGDHSGVMDSLELTRCSEEEKQARLRDLSSFHARHATDAKAALARLQAVAIEGGNIFAELMSTARHASLGQITRALFGVGGEYRRNM